MRNFLYVSDVGLKARSGHHVGVLRTLTQCCGTQYVVFYGNQKPTPELLVEVTAAGAAMRPFFSTFYYDAIHTNSRVAEVNNYINFLAGEYVRLFEEVALKRPAGWILHHTLDWPHLQALGMAVGQGYQSCTRMLQHVVSLMHGPGVNVFGRVSDQRRFLSHRMALLRLNNFPNVALFASDLEIADALAVALPEAGRIPVHPCFFFNPSNLQKRPEPLESSDLRECLNKGTIILYVGNVREEKGFGKLPEIINVIRPHLGSEGRLLIQFDVNRELSPLDGNLTGALEELRRIAAQDSRIQLIDGYLPDDELNNLISESVLFVFNYDSRIYASRTSGLLWQACSATVPVVIIGESWLSREARRLNPATFSFSSLTDLEGALSKKSAIPPDQVKIDLEYRKALFGSLDEFLTRVSSVNQHDGEWMPHFPARANRRGKRPKILVVDADMPNPDTSGGGYAAVQEIRMLKALGYSVSFSTVSGCFINQQAPWLIDQGIELLCRPRYQDASQVLVERGHEFDLIYATRYHVAKTLMEDVRFFAPQGKLILNVADLHFLRELRKAGLSQNESAMKFAEDVRVDELATLCRVDLVLTYTEVEEAIIRSHLKGKCRVARCPWVEEPHRVTSPHAARRDIAFLGGYAHAPNVDAVVWFIEEVMPCLRRVLPGVCFRVYGANVPPLLQRYAGEDVIVRGFSETLSEVFDSCRVFVVPLRYGAGLKAKVAAALARGVPCIVSPIAAEGFSVESNVGMVVAHAPEEWAAAISTLYRDSNAWEAASRAALKYASNHFQFDDGVRRMAGALSTLNEADVA